MWKIQQAKQDDTELIRRTHQAFISVTTTAMLGGLFLHSLLPGYFFFAGRARAMRARLRDFSLRPNLKNKNKINKNKYKGGSQKFSHLIDSCGTRTFGPGHLKSFCQWTPLLSICNGWGNREEREGIGGEMRHFARPKTFYQKLSFPRFYNFPRQSILVFFFSLRNKVENLLFLFKITVTFTSVVSELIKVKVEITEVAFLAIGLATLFTGFLSFIRSCQPQPLWRY